MNRQATVWLAAAALGFAAGCGVGFVSDDASDVASVRSELSVKDCLGQLGFDAGFLGEDGGWAAFQQCVEQAGIDHHGCSFEDGGFFMHHGDGGFPAGFGHHDGGWFGHHHHGDGGPDADDDDGGFGFGFHGGDGGCMGGHGDGGWGSHHGPGPGGPPGDAGFGGPPDDAGP